MPLHPHRPLALDGAGQTKLLERWLRNGGDAAALDRRGGRGTPLHAAAQANQPKCIQLLLMWGADPSALTKLRGTPLHAAALHDSRHAVQALLDG